jgi:hypothetical protein
MRGLQNLGTDIYTVGINLRNTNEIDAVSSKPLDNFQVLVNSERELDEVPGIFLYRMERGQFRHQTLYNLMPMPGRFGVGTWFGYTHSFSAM